MLMIFRVLLYLFLFLPFLETKGQVVYTDHVASELVSENNSIVPGESFWIALRMEMDEGWYIYWKNPGDSGMPVLIEWDKPYELQISDIHWQYPKWIDVQGLTSYGHYGEVFLLMEAKLDEATEVSDELTINAVADWLVCEDVCIPGYGSYSLTLPISDQAEFSEWKSDFDHTRTLWPHEEHEISAQAWTEGNRYVMKLDGPSAVLERWEELKFFADTEATTENGGPQQLMRDGDDLFFLIEKSSYATSDIETLSGVLYSPQGFDSDGEVVAITVSVPIDDEPMFFADSSAGTSLAMALVFALIGGLILNLMPCVFPVLSIKIMHFVHLGGGNKDVIRMHGVLFALGILVSFLILAAVLIGLRSAGQELGWGFQLQSPVFIGILAFLMFGLALNLLGVFEIGNSIINIAGKASVGEGYRSAFLMGVLATILATPCTAPFMGAALGFALTLPAAQALLIFGFLGFGMAIPYVLLSFFPKMISYLPKPGAWMETLKQAMAFPLFATVLWLAWVFGAQTGFDGLFALLTGLLLASLGAWILHRWQPYTISNKARIISRSIAGLLLAGGLFVALSSANTDATTAQSGSGTDNYGIEWISFTPDIVDELRSDGRHVFIDFTAAWCITCKANERVVFSSSEVRERFRDLDVAMVKADWTNRNPDITRALSEFNRSGVPLYLLYNADGSAPQVLPELLTPGIVMNALSNLENRPAAHLNNDF